MPNDGQYGVSRESLEDLQPFGRGFVAALRWKLLLRGLGFELGFFRAMRFQFVALFMTVMGQEGKDRVYTIELDRKSVV